MPSLLSICLALLRLAIRTTNCVQGLLIGLHDTVEWAIEQQVGPTEISSTGEKSSPTPSRLHPSPDTVDVEPSESTSSTISTTEDGSSLSILEAFRSKVSQSEVPIISSTSGVFKSAQSAVGKSENSSGMTGHPSVEDEANIDDKESTTEPVQSIMPLDTPPTSQGFESTKSMDDFRNKKCKSEKTSSIHSSDSACSSQISEPTSELETDVPLELKAQPESFMPRIRKPTYNLDLKFEKNFHLTEYDTSTIREKGTSKITKSSVRDTDSNANTQPQVRHSLSDRKKTGKTPVKSKSKSPISSSVAAALPQSFSLPRFSVDSTTGNVQWKSDMPRKDSSPVSKQRSPHRQSNKSPRKANLEIGTLSEATIPRQILTKKMEPGSEGRILTEQHSERLRSETSTSEDEFQFKPTRERRPTPPARFPKVETSTDSENVECKAKSSSFITEPIKMSSESSEFKPTRERRLTPAARLPILEFTRMMPKGSADKDDKNNDQEKCESLSNETSVEESEFKSTRERRPTPAAKFVDHESTTSSNKSDKSSKLGISVPREKEKSPLRFQQKPILTTKDGFTVKSTRNVVNDRPEQFLKPRNQSIGIPKSGEFAFKPTRERRPTPAARFPTPESTDTKKACEKPTLPLQASQSLNSEESAMNEEVSNTACEYNSSCVPRITISGSPTGKQVSPMSKPVSRHVRKSFTSPRNSGKSRVEGKLSPTVRFQIPESLTKSEHTGTTRKEWKLASRKTAKEMSTSEEECDSKLSNTRKESPAKYPFFKSPRKLSDAADTARSLKFSPTKTSSEIKVETRPLGADSESANTASASYGSMLTELLGCINKRSGEGALTPESEVIPYDEDLYASTFEGNSGPEGDALERPCSHPAIRAPHNSPNNMKTADETSTEMSQSESTTGTTTSDGQDEDSALEAETDVCPLPENSLSTSTEDDDARFLRQHGIRLEPMSASPDSINDSSIGYESGEDSAPEGAARLIPLSTPDSSVPADNVDISVKDSTFESTRIKSTSDGSRSDSETEKKFYLGLQTQPENSVSLSNNDMMDESVGTDSTSLNLTEASGSNISEEDSSPEGTTNLFPQLKTIESPVNAEENKDEVHSDTYPIMTESTRTCVESDTRIEADATLLESLELVESGVDSAPEGTETLFLQTSTTNFPTNTDNLKDNSPEMHPKSSEAKSHESTTRDVVENSASENTLGICKLPENDKLSSSVEKIKNKPCEEIDSPLPESAPGNTFIKQSCGDSQSTLSSGCYSHPETKEMAKNKGDSDASSSETDSTSSESAEKEKSSSAETEDDPAPEGAPSVLSPETETSKSPINTEKESNDKFNAGTDSASLELPSSDTTRNKRFEDFSPEDATYNCPKVESDKSKTDSIIFNKAETDFASGENDCSAAEEGRNPQLSYCESSSPNSTDHLSDHACLVVEMPSTDSESNAPERLSPVSEVSRNGTVTDFSYVESENGYSISSPTEPSSEDEGEFVIEQQDPNSPSLFCISPTNGDSSSGPHPIIHQELSDRNEYLHTLAGVSKISESDVMSSTSLSSLSKSSNSEEEGDNVPNVVEAISEPNTDMAPETSELTSSLNQESKNMTDQYVDSFNQNVCLEENKLEVSDCKADVRVQTIAGNNIPQDTVPPSRSPIVDVGLDINLVDTSFSLSSTGEITRISSVEGNTDETEVLDTEKSPSFISIKSTSMEIENSIVSKKEYITELGDVLVAEKEIFGSELTSEDSSTKQEYGSGNDVSQSEICTIKEPVVNEEVTETSSVFVQEASECEKVGDDTITSNVTDSQLLASDTIKREEMINYVENGKFPMPIDTDVSELNDCRNFKIQTSPPSVNIEGSPSVEQVESENASAFSESFVGDGQINMDSAKYDYGEVSTQPFIAGETSVEGNPVQNVSNYPVSETLVTELPKNVDVSELNKSTLDNPIAPNTTGTVQNEAENDTVVSNVIIKLEEFSETRACDSTESITVSSIETEHKEKDDCLNIEAQVPSELICNSPTREGAEISSNSDIIPIGTDFLILQDGPNVKLQLEIEHVAQQATIPDLPRITCPETIVDHFPEIPESIINEVSVDEVLEITESTNSENISKSELPIRDDFTISENNETGSNIDPEERIYSEIDLEVSQRKHSSELKESNLSQLAISDSLKDTEAINDYSENTVLMCNSSNDCGEHIEPNKATELEVYIASEPVTADIALGSTIQVLLSSTDDSSPDIEYIGKFPDSEPSATQFGGKLTENTGGYGQDLETNLDSEICESSTTADIAKESSITKPDITSMGSDELANADIEDKSPISKSNVAIEPMVSEESIVAEELAFNANLEPSVLDVSVCEVLKDNNIENVDEMQELTSSLEVTSSLDSAQSANPLPEDGKEVEENSSTKVENKAWKQKPKKSKKKRRH